MEEQEVRGTASMLREAKDKKKFKEIQR